MRQSQSVQILIKLSIIYSAAHFAQDVLLHFVAYLKHLGNSFIVRRELRPKIFRRFSVNLCPTSVYYIRNYYSLRR